MPLRSGEWAFSVAILHILQINYAFFCKKTHCNRCLGVI